MFASFQYGFGHLKMRVWDRQVDDDIDVRRSNKIFNGVSPGSFRRYYYYDAYSRYAYGDDLIEDDEEPSHV